MGGSAGILLVTMEPRAGNEEEFNDWYDMEHIPERAAVPGFRNALRWVCLEGFPRYMASYDLDDVEVLRSPEYARVAVASYSPWTTRMMPRAVQGQFRIEGVQIFPGDATTLDGDRRGRLATIRIRDVDAAVLPAVVDGLRRRFEGLPSVAQIRLYRIANFGGRDCIALVEQRMPLTDFSVDPARFGDWAFGIDRINLYSPYWRRSPLPRAM